MYCHAEDSTRSCLQQIHYLYTQRQKRARGKCPCAQTKIFINFLPVSSNVVVSQKVDWSINLHPAIVLNTSGPVMISSDLPRTGSPCTGGSWQEACHSASSRINLQHAMEIFRHQMEVLMGKSWENIGKSSTN